MWPTLPTKASNCNFSVSKDLVYSLQPSLTPWTNTFWQLPQTNSTVSSAPSVGLLALSSCSVFIWSHNQQHSSPQPTRQSLLAPNHDSWQQAPPTIVCIAACPNHSSHLSMHVPITILPPPIHCCYNPNKPFLWQSWQSISLVFPPFNDPWNHDYPLLLQSLQTICHSKPSNQVLWQPHHSMVYAISTINCFFNPDIP